MLAVALEAEVDAYIAGYAEQVDERGHRLVRRNGHAPARTIAAGVGQVEVVRPRVDDRRVDPATGQRQQFQSMILPARVNLSEASSLRNHCVVAGSSFGSLIHTAVGSAGGSGGLRTKRSGCLV